MTTNANDPSEARLMELEVRYTYLERHLRELDQVVIDLRGEIDRLKRQLTALTRAAAEQGSSPLNEKPPHY